MFLFLGLLFCAERRFDGRNNLKMLIKFTVIHAFIYKTRCF